MNAYDSRDALYIYAFSTSECAVVGSSRAGYNQSLVDLRICSVWPQRAVQARYGDDTLLGASQVSNTFSQPVKTGTKYNANHPRRNDRNLNSEVRFFV
jgi:hypothetical protein